MVYREMCILASTVGLSDRLSKQDQDKIELQGLEDKWSQGSGTRLSLTGWSGIREIIIWEILPFVFGCIPIVLKRSW